MLPHSLSLWERLGASGCGRSNGTSTIRIAPDVASHCKNSALADEADDILCRLHSFIGYRARAIGAVDQDLIDMAGIGHQPLHLGGDRRQFGDAKLDQRILETGELSAAEVAQHFGLGPAG